MNRLNLFIALVAPVLGLVVSATAQISSPESREALLERAERLTMAKVDPGMGESLADTKDPFYPGRTPAAGSQPVAGNSTAGAEKRSTPDSVILREATEHIRPTGVMQFGQETLLLFGERRVKVGDFLSVQHKGQKYRLEVMKADSRGFILRLNDELISKRIK